MAVSHRQSVDGVFIQLVQRNVSIVVESGRHGQHGLKHQLLTLWTTGLATDSHRTFDRGRVDHHKRFPSVIEHRGFPNRTHHLSERTERRRHSATHERRLAGNGDRIDRAEDATQLVFVAVDAPHSVAMDCRCKRAPTVAGAVQGTGLGGDDGKCLHVEGENPHPQRIRAWINTNDARMPRSPCRHR
jgi:hypothetical protein